MRRISFIIAVFGIFVLIILIWMLPVKEIENLEDLDGLVNNQKVVLSGLVEGEKNYYGNLIMEIKGVKVVCEGCESYLGNVVEIIGVIEEYGDKKEVEVLEIYPVMD